MFIDTDKPEKFSGVNFVVCVDHVDDKLVAIDVSIVNILVRSWLGWCVTMIMMMMAVFMCQSPPGSVHYSSQHVFKCCQFCCRPLTC